MDDDNILTFGGLEPETEYEVVTVYRTNAQGQFKIAVEIDNSRLRKLIVFDPKAKRTIQGTPIRDYQNIDTTELKALLKRKKLISKK